MRYAITALFILLVFVAGTGVGYVAGVAHTWDTVNESQRLNDETKVLLKKARRLVCGTVV